MSLFGDILFYTAMVPFAIALLTPRTRLVRDTLDAALERSRKLTEKQTQVILELARADELKKTEFVWRDGQSKKVASGDQGFPNTNWRALLKSIGELPPEPFSATCPCPSCGHWATHWISRSVILGTTTIYVTRACRECSHTWEQQ